jgi:hypothetical protein
MISYTEAGQDGRKRHQEEYKLCQPTSVLRHKLILWQGIIIKTHRKLSHALYLEYFKIQGKDWGHYKQHKVTLRIKARSKQCPKDAPGSEDDGQVREVTQNIDA